MATTGKIKYLIIGNSAGGIGAAEAIREVDKTGAVTIISDEPYPAYSRPLISEYLASPCPIEKMFYRPPDFYEKNNIKTVFDERVVGIHPRDHTVKLENGTVLGWKKLLIATGGTPIVPEMEGGRLKGVFTFNRLDDAKAIDDFLNRHPGRLRAVVIGAFKGVSGDRSARGSNAARADSSASMDSALSESPDRVSRTAST